MISRSGPRSSMLTAASHPAAAATSRKNGVNRYETTPMATQRLNHCEKLATKPR